VLEYSRGATLATEAVVPAQVPSVIALYRDPPQTRNLACKVPDNVFAQVDRGLSVVIRTMGVRCNGISWDESGLLGDAGFNLSTTAYEDGAVEHVFVCTSCLFGPLSSKLRNAWEVFLPLSLYHVTTPAPQICMPLLTQVVRASYSWLVRLVLKARSLS
jgi:hypothetical protein